MTADELTNLREDLRVSQTELGRLLSVDPTTIWRWERGEGPRGLQAVLLRALRERVARRGAAWGREIVLGASSNQERAIDRLFEPERSAAEV